MPVRNGGSVDAGILKLSNSHVSLLDLDADGRINLVHMPDFEKYTVFTPVLEAGAWVWSGAGVAAPKGQSFKIDWTRHAKHSATMDVNGDGLVDVVYTSSTEVQTFFSLGRFPGGRGMFGQASWASPGEASLSTEPVKACIPWSATPVRFGDADVRVAEMNGDGLPDIVRIRNNQVLYWPGRGNGTWGTGERDDCLAGQFATERALEVSNPPRLGTVDVSTVLLSDVNGDGLSDLIEVRANAVDVYLNENGVGFTERSVLENTPVHPNGSSRVALADIDGSGTPDLLWGEARNYQYMDLTGGVQPYVLTRAHNGLGGTTTLEYSTSTKLMLAAEAAGKKWDSVMPMVVPVVVRSTAEDHLDRVGRAGSAMVTEYSYRNPVFDGKNREFRGFREAMVRNPGDSNSPTSVRRSEFLLGHPSDDQTPVESTDEERWREALKGMPVVEEELAESGVVRATRHTSVTIQPLYEGLDGRKVYARPTSKVTAFLYDTGNFDGAGSNVSLTDYMLTDGDTTRTSTRMLPLRAGAGTARVESTTSQDSFGNVTSSTKNGCVSGCPNGTDEAITTTSVFERPEGDASGWMWREVESYVSGSVHTAMRHRRGARFNSYGESVESFAWLEGTQALQRNEPVGPVNQSAGTGEAVLVSLGTTEHDMFGNPTSAMGPLGGCHSIVVDEQYAEFVTEDHSYAGPVGIDGCGVQVFTTTASYDRGFGIPITVTSPRGQPSSIEVDGFGRVTAEYGPSLENPGSIDPNAVRVYEYLLTTDATAQPYSMLRSQTLDVSSSGALSYVEDVGYVDGLGRTLFTLSEADPSGGDGGKYILSGGTQYNAKGMAFLTHEPEFYPDDPAQFSVARQMNTGTKEQRYDAFGRVVEIKLQDGLVKSQAVYHALSADTYDAGDWSPGSAYLDTYSTQISDGHGRPVVGISRYRKDSGGATEEHRTVTQYLPSGEVTQITQQREGSADLVRSFEYDSWGRMVANLEPNSTATTGSGSTAVTKSWRYAYDDRSRLVGTSNALGCGVNYHYDAGGRLLGSDYVPCGTNYPAYSAPNLETGYGLETQYLYDGPATTETITDATGQTPTVNPAWSFGRLWSTRTRGAVSVFAYDSLGRSVGTATRIAKPGNQSADVADRYAPRWYVKKVAYDKVNRPIAVSTGAPLAALHASDGTSEMRMDYTRRGLVRTVSSSYGTLITSQTRDARGLLDEVVFGDGAQTRRSYSYNELTQVTDVTTYRAPAGLWTTGTSPYTLPPASPPTTQLTLEDYRFTYDVMGNLTSAEDWRTKEEWPDGNRPVSRTWGYDSYSRLTKATYTYAGASTWQTPFAPENSNTALTPQPVPQVDFANKGRITEETFEYDWLNNLVKNGDNSNGFYDRSIGRATFSDSARPHRMTASSNRYKGSSRQGELAVAYDAIGQVTAMVVQRDGGCLPTTSSCWQRYGYDWDEVGNLTRARRWDLTTSERTSFGTSSSVNGTHPTRTPNAELTYQYDGGSRVVKSVTRPSPTNPSQTETKHTVYPLSSVELRSTTWTGTGDAADYAVNTETTSLRLGAGPVNARVVYNAAMPKIGASNLHMLMQFSDQLGSTTFVVEHATGEMVEYVTYTAYGQTESDYRNQRWQLFREQYRFTGNEDDAEVGLSYHGARYYSPALKRFMSADPVTVHSAGSDINPYSYGNGNPTMYVDPEGRFAWFVGAIISSAVYICQNGVQLDSAGWWKGLAIAAGSGAVGAYAGAAVGVTASTAAGAAASGALSGMVGSAAGYATAWTATGMTGGDTSGYSLEGLATAAITGSISGAVGGAVGFTSGNYAGAVAGTTTGIVTSSALTGESPTAASLGISFGSAFGGAMLSASLSANEMETAEIEASGQASGEAAGRAYNGTRFAMAQRFADELLTSIAALPDTRVACTPWCEDIVITDKVGKQLPPDAKAALDAGKIEGYKIALKEYVVGVLLTQGFGLVARAVGWAAGGAGLAHVTDAGNAITASGTLGLGRSGIYATSLETAGHTGMALTLRTGVSGATAGVRIPAAAEAAFSRPVPIGLVTTWQRLFGTQYTAAGTIDLVSGTFTRTGVNWNQIGIYAFDASTTGTVGLGVGYSF